MGQTERSPRQPPGSLSQQKRLSGFRQGDGGAVDGFAPENQTPPHRLRRSFPNGRVRRLSSGAARDPLLETRPKRRQTDTRQVPQTAFDNLGRHVASSHPTEHARRESRKYCGADGVGVRRRHLQIRAAPRLGQVRSCLQDGVDGVGVQGGVRGDSVRARFEKASREQSEVVGGHVGARHQFQEGLHRDSLDWVAALRSFRRPVRTAAGRYTIASFKPDSHDSRLL